jgi:hypothetical protein
MRKDENIGGWRNLQGEKLQNYVLPQYFDGD